MNVLGTVLAWVLVVLAVACLVLYTISKVLEFRKAKRIEAAKKAHQADDAAKKVD
jgi:hypothetical protein